MTLLYIFLPLAVILFGGILVQRKIDKEIAIEHELQRDQPPKPPCCNCCKCPCHSHGGVSDGGSFGLG